ncbi:MAG: hypothetical protein H0X02_12865 [Nitrosomonas sp.]|nr:hypothetical protein [Nitrosomonas sp.]
MNKVKSIIRNNTGLGEVRISGIEIYDKLTAAGVDVPELAIAEILERLSKEKLIEIERQVISDDQEKQGTYIITWVGERL